MSLRILIEEMGTDIPPYVCDFSLCGADAQYWFGFNDEARLFFCQKHTLQNTEVALAEHSADESS